MSQTTGLTSPVSSGWCQLSMVFCTPAKIFQQEIPETQLGYFGDAKQALYHRTLPKLPNQYRRMLGFRSFVLLLGTQSHPLLSD